MAQTKKKKDVKKKLNELLEISPQLIQDLLNEHISDTDRYHGRFHCGHKLGYGGSGIVYKLHYEKDACDTDDELASLNLAIKAVNPLQAFLRAKPNMFTLDQPVDDILNSADFASFMRGGKRVLESVARCHEKKYYEHHFLHYYPDLSFSIDSIIPCASIVVMDEVAGTLEELSLPEDIPSIIRMCVKLGKEIGGALQAAEYAYDGTGFLHRDIKPANIGITLNLNNPEVYEFVLIDIESGIAEDSITDSTRTLIVNEFTMAPELLDGTPRYEIDFARVDMYHLGALMNYICQDKFEILPDGLKRIIRKASHKDPSHRYDNGEELIEDLEKFEDEFSMEEAGESLTLQKFMEEQEEKLADMKRENQARNNKLKESLKKKRAETAALKEEKKSLEAQIKKWKADYDLQIEQEELLNKEAEEYKNSAEARISDLESSLSKSEKIYGTLNKNLNTLKKQFEDFKIASETETAYLEAVKNRLNTSLEEAEAENERLLAENKKLKEQSPAETSVSNQITCITEKKNGQVTAVIHRFYDETGRLIREDNGRITSKYSYETDGKILKTTHSGKTPIEIVLYEEHGKPLEHTFFEKGKKSSILHYRYTYGRRSRISAVYVNDVLSEKHSYELYDSGEVSEHTVEMTSENVLEIHIEKFDRQGQLQTLITYFDDQDEENTDYTKTTYSYNDDTCVSETTENQDHVLQKITTRHLDSFGRLILETTVDYAANEMKTREYAY